MAGVGAHPRLPGCEFKHAPLALPPLPHTLRLVRSHVLPLHPGAAPRDRALGHSESALRQVLRECPQLSSPAARLLGATTHVFGGVSSAHVVSSSRGCVADAFGRARGGKAVVEIGREVGATLPARELFA